MAKNKAFQAAEKKIAEALRTGATELDLSGSYVAKDLERLTELPEALSQLTQLQSLDLGNNQLTALPEWLGQLTQLQSLDLGNNQLTALPEWLGQLTQLQSLDLSGNRLMALPEWLGRLTQLQSLNLSDNRLTVLPESLGQLTQLRSLFLFENQLETLPESLGQLKQLRFLRLDNNQLSDFPRFIREYRKLIDLRVSTNPLREIPAWIGELHKLKILEIANNLLTDLPKSISELQSLHDIYLGNLKSAKQTKWANIFKMLPDVICPLQNLKVLWVNDCSLTVLPDWVGDLINLESLNLQNNELADLPNAVNDLAELTRIDLENNPLNPELASAYEEGLDAVKRYLRAKADAQVVLNEAKLILVGEGEVGKSCLLGALRGDPWEEDKPTTHGIEIKPVKVTDPNTGTEITLNGWDFGGQRVYRPTHQLFFTAPAVYLVVWKPREGPQQGFVKEWIKLVKHREPDAKILVVATHGGPKERQPDIDRQEIWDMFGKDTVVDFFLVQSKPDEATGERHGIAELKEAIARVAASLPEMGRTFPATWQKAREALRECGEAYLPLKRVLEIFKEHKVGEEDAHLLLRICRSVGDLIHFEHDPVLRDIVVLKPDWLSTAMSFVLDDEYTRKDGHGLVSFARLGQLWNNPDKPAENRYPAELHPVFVRLMERFDLCYRVAEAGKIDADGTSLIAQLVPDVRPDLGSEWPASPAAGDEQQVQVCRIVDATKNESATTEGLFFQLIVRLHKYSLGRADYARSVHWQRGLVLEDDTGARAFLEHIGTDVRITVRSPYPGRFLSALTYDVKWLVEYFWKGVRCEVTVPCLTTSADDQRCNGLFNVNDLIEDLKDGRPEQKCPVCKKWLKIEQLLGNAPASRPNPIEELLANFADTMKMLRDVRQQLGEQHTQVIGRFDRLDASEKELVSKVEGAYDGFMKVLTDEARDGPRLFSFQPVDPGFFGRPTWASQKFRLTLWCEHSRLPLPELNGEGSMAGVYELNLPREWFEKAAPFLKVLTGTLSLVLPVAASATKFMMDETAYKGLENELNLGEKSLDSVLKGGEKSGEWLGQSDAPDIERGEAIRAQGAVLRQLHAWLKEKDSSFGGLVRVQNKRQEFLWVHQQFESEY